MTSKVELIIEATDRASGVLSGIGGVLKNLGAIALTTVAAGGVAFGKFLIDSVGEAANAELAIADLNAVIASTNGIAGITSQAAQDLASSLQSVTRFSDETIMKAEGMLLTFTNIGKNVFPVATETVLNMAEKFGSAESAAIQLGKALNDPIEGVSALRRVGVQFTDQQEALIKSLIAAGDLEGAQKIILGELQTEFGGLAIAAGNTAAGLKDRFMNQLSDIQETIGTAVLPSLMKLGDTLMTTFSDPQVQEFISVFAQKLADISMITIDWILELPNKIKELGDAVSSSPFGTFLEFMALWWQANGESIRTTATALFDGIGDAIGRASSTLGPFVEEILAKLMLWFAENGPLISEYIAVMGATFGYLVDAIVLFWEAVQPILSAFLSTMLSWATLVMQVLTGDFAGAWETLKVVVSNVLATIKALFASFFSLILQLLGSNVKEFTDVWSNNWNMLVQILGAVKNNIVSKFGEWRDVGVQLIQSLIDGVRSAVGALISVAVGAVSSALNAASGALNLGGGGSGGGGGNRGYADGGISTGPSSGHFELLHGTEAIIPLKGGFVPVQISGAPGGGGGAVFNIHLNYAPSMSFGDENEAQNKLLPFIIQGIREAQANGTI